ADIGDREDALGVQRALDAQAPLIAGRLLVFGKVQTGDVRRIDGQRTGRAGSEREARIVELHRAGSIQLEAEGNVRTSVVHVAALNALVHDAETAAEHGLAVAEEVIGEANAWTEGVPVVVDEALRDPVLAGDADAVQVKGHAGENGV